MRGILEQDCRTTKSAKMFSNLPDYVILDLDTIGARLRCMTVFFSSQPQHEQGRKTCKSAFISRIPDPASVHQKRGCYFFSLYGFLFITS